MIKYTLRKPLFAILLLVLLIFEVVFMGLMRRGIEEDMQAIENLYDTSTVTFDVLPGIQSAGDLVLRPHFTYSIEKMPEIEAVYYTIACPYLVREPEKNYDGGWIYGTNNPVWFTNSQVLEVKWAEGFEPGPDDRMKDWTENDGDIPCIADERVLEKYGLSLGDRFVIASYDDYNHTDSDLSPSIQLYVIGSFDNRLTPIPAYSLIVPKCIFEDPPSVLYYWRMSERYFSYPQYRMQIKKEYNRNIDEIEEKLSEKFERADAIVHSDVRVLKKTVRPIEQRLKIQKTLELPLEITLSVATALMAMLLALSIQDDIFLYLMLGESRIKTFLISMSGLFGIVLGCALVAFAIGFAVLGTAWVGWLLKYIGFILALCFVVSMIPVILFCGKNLVHFYQTKEE